MPGGRSKALRQWLGCPPPNSAMSHSAGAGKGPKGREPSRAPAQGPLQQPKHALTPPGRRPLAPVWRDAGTARPGTTSQPSPDGPPPRLGGPGVFPGPGSHQTGLPGTPPRDADTSIADTAFSAHSSQPPPRDAAGAPCPAVVHRGCPPVVAAVVRTGGSLSKNREAPSPSPWCCILAVVAIHVFQVNFDKAGCLRPRHGTPLVGKVPPESARRAGMTKR